MVEQDLQRGVDELVGEVVQLDVVSIIQMGVGFGVGLFGAEFIAQIVGSMLQNQRRVVRTIGELLSKGVLTGIFAFGYNSGLGGPLISFLMGAAALGVTTSAVLQVVEASAETLARIAQGDISVSRPSASASDLGASGYGGGSSGTEQTASASNSAPSGGELAV